jgi:hypothetical protein
LKNTFARQNFSLGKEACCPVPTVDLKAECFIRLMIITDIIFVKN